MYSEPMYTASTTWESHASNDSVAGHLPFPSTAEPVLRELPGVEGFVTGTMALQIQFD